MSKTSKNIIAFMGIAGANADLACRKAEPYMETLPCPNFESVFEAVRDGEAAIGMLPMENSHAGRVSEIHNLLPKMGVSIVGEYFLNVNHVLAAVEGTKIEDVKKAYSHPQALMQCSDSLRKLGIEAISSSNTAVAAQDVKKWSDNTKAAICSDLAAEICGLEVIADNLQDSDYNITTFIKISQNMLDEDILEDADMLLTSILFEARNIPAALYKALGGFATNSVNIMKLESYIAGGSSKNAEFFMTFIGQPDDKPVQMALEELSFFTRKVEVLGIYPAAAERSKSGI